MSVGKFVSIALGLLFMAGLVVMGCEGDEGPQGPTGLTGPQGDPGHNRQVIPPADRFFGIMVANGTEADLKGAAKVAIDFDSVLGSGSGVFALQLDRAPALDGVDGGEPEWGLAPKKTISLDVLQGVDNGVAAISARAGYDLDYVYLQFSWTETDTDDFTAAADTAKNMWTYSAEGNLWSQSGGEDKLYIVWNIDDLTLWGDEGLGALIGPGGLSTPAAGELADLWLWRSTVTGYVHYLADMVVKSAGEGGEMLDFGRSFVLENVDGSRPAYMLANSNLSGSDYPLWYYEFESFAEMQVSANLADTIYWTDAATVPGYVFFTPTSSAADVEAVARFAEDTWTVEVRRRRNTGNADDVRF